MKYIHSNSFIYILQICKIHYIPSDISHIIFKHFINISAQIIIDSWYNHILIHNINLVQIISHLSLYMTYDNFGMPYYYYNLYDKKIGITFNICYKYMDFKICDIDWWIQRVTYAFNSLNICVDVNNDNFIYNYNAVSNFSNSVYIYRYLNNM